MIITLICLGIVIIGIFIGVFSNSFECDYLGWIVRMCGGILLFLCIITIITSHTFVNRKIYEKEIEYDGLIKQCEALQSRYEDISNTTVISDVTEWNKDVYGYKYTAENPFTSWFISGKVADSLHYIDIDDI